MEVKLINGIVLAEKYNELVNWYMETFKLEKKVSISEDYHYTELASEGKIILGIADAEEMKIKPVHPRSNTVVIQIAVHDISFLFQIVKATGGKVLFGPTKDEENDFTYGGIADMEGNEIWVIEEQEDISIPEELKLGRH
ncbi:MAG: hypothetical protein H8E57_02825 [Candidatus Cloacimonetes bacterium]|nr:hypothetical protein [Candidatus Cloacimonadota bacterium]